MIELSEYQSRRRALGEHMQDNSLCLVPAAREVTRSRDTQYPFRQDSDFSYLTGFSEPDAVLLISKQQGHVESTLFCLAKDPQAEIWHGRRMGPEQARISLDIDKCIELEQLPVLLPSYLAQCNQFYFAQGTYEHIDGLVFSCFEQLRKGGKKGQRPPGVVIDIRDYVHEKRLIKSDAEISLMRRAARISVDAHKRAMAFARPGRYEYQLEAELHHEFALQGARYPAYGTIVGSGDNACILHYTENQDELKAGNLVLIDAGAELMGYAADITRTFPVSGAFSEPQALLYQLVLDAQLAAFEQIKPGSTLICAMEEAVLVITRGLLKLGVLQGSLEANLAEKTYRQYFMHGLGHWLGLDVHDVGEYRVEGEDRPLQPGMVLTVEPGIYIPVGADVERKWQGIGIRIEDNLLVTATGHENLTAGAPKAIHGIEQLMAGSV
ncbi:Xaa-Pro aminopeptidase [Lacimicrobium alkaliphilum]|uniref:Xaa-Pro aminopeptidase n=1 Tax=Lacimicrobium alkaliphilum TaxID=1526571 RepID=A0ABQ1QWH6_9ALTE|nr:Xaa-Pro aminopeptidase [Lacimicrobium alkaliphilum]GGD49832.1 Xaa-Pro aminopeptidase [Lacimicrobium alkaliphilum]